MASRRSWLLAGLFAAIAVAAVAIVALRARLDPGVERVKDAIAWPSGCAEVAIHDQTHWPHAIASASITCEYLGPMVLYARFASDAELRNDLLSDPPPAPTCIAGHEVMVDYLERGQFPALCRKFGGDRIDAVSMLPDLPWDGTVGGLDRQVEAGERRDAAAQRRALRRYWHTA